MIIDRTWNKKEQKLTISYIDKMGNRQFYQKYLHHIKTYEYDKDGEIETWNGKRARKVYKDTLNYTPNEFDILEYLYEMEPDVLKQLHAQNFPKIYTFDIETEVSSEFPDPHIAAQIVTAISLVGPDLSCIVYGLKDMDVKLFRQRYLDWINNNEFASNLVKSKGFNPKVLYQKFDSEEEMLKHFFTVIVPKITCLAGWNSYNFDWNYLVNRLIKLFGEREAMFILRKSSPTGELVNYSWEVPGGLHEHQRGPAHTRILDYMELVKSYDRVIAPTAESFGLDWVGEHAVKANKIKYDGSLQQLYERDPEWYYFYNGIDALIVNLIHYRLKAVESPCAVSSVTLVPLMDAMGQIALTTANVFEEFYNDNKRVVWDYDAVERFKVPYEGAFCGCVSGRHEWNVCYDFKSLYPSQIITCNLSFENFVEPPMIGPDSFGRYIKGAWTPKELDEFRQDPNYFVSVMGNVYKNDKQYGFPKLQARVLKNRDIYKYTGQRIDSELLAEIDRLIKEKEAELAA